MARSGNSPTESFHADFDYDLALGLADQLVAAFKEMPKGSLTRAEVAKLRASQGVYMILLEDEVVYVGKAANARDRLGHHQRRVSGRHHLDVEAVGFKCLYIHKNWAPIGPENILISRLKADGKAAWNNSGFGPKDPGVERDTTKNALDGFYAQYPLDLGVTCPSVSAKEWEVNELLQAMKRDLPWLFRYQTKGHLSAGHPAYNDRVAVVPRPGMKAEELLLIVGEATPGARITVFPSHVIMYINDKKQYPNGEQLYPTQ